MKLESESSAEVYRPTPSHMSGMQSFSGLRSASFTLYSKLLHFTLHPKFVSFPGRSGLGVRPATLYWDHWEYSKLNNKSIFVEVGSIARWSGLGANGYLIIANRVWNPRQWIQLRTLGRLSVYWVLSLQVYTDPQYSVCSMEGECMLVYEWVCLDL